MLRRQRPLIVVGGLVAIACAVVGIAYAAIPGGGTITGCYVNNAGTLRVIDPAVASCRSNEQQLEWNQTGPAGADGTDGTNGTNGVSGYEVQTELENAVGSLSSSQAAIVFCSDGKSVLGGGFSALKMAANGGFFLGEVPVRVLRSEPTNSDNGWFVDVLFDPATIADDEIAAIRVQAICANMN